MDPHPIVTAELYAPLDVVVSLLSDKEPDAERYRRINDAIMADILGEAPVSPPPSNLPREATDVLHAILALYSCVDRFAIFEDMFRRYPWRGKISKVAHIESTFYLLAHETYILEERLKTYFATIDAFARVEAIPIDVARIRKSLLAVHRKTFGDIVQLRGRHVHEEEVAPREIKRARLLNTLTLGQDPVYEKLYNVALRDARATWARHSETAKISSQQIAATAFTLTKSVWSALTK